MSLGQGSMERITQQKFLALAERFRLSTDEAEVARLEEQLGEMIFGDRCGAAAGLGSLRAVGLQQEERVIVIAHPITPGGEAAIWARLIESQPGELTPEAARYLLALQFDEKDQSRVQELADRSQAGTLSEDDAREFDSYLHIAKARIVLDRQAASHPHS